MAKAIFAGSFDPFTVGHLYICEKSSELFDTVIICIATNEQKVRTFSKELMKQGIEETLREKDITNCEVVCYDGLIVDFAKQKDIDFIVRGLRNPDEFEYEKAVAKNYYETGGLETIYVGPGTYTKNKVPEEISSTLVRNLLREHKSVSKYVPKSIEKLITK